MPRRKKSFTKATYERRLKEGRGQGDGANYRPYIFVQDFSSCGQSNRDYGLTTLRQHDYFSKLEHRVHLIYDNSDLLDIKEQFPHPLERTLEIAKYCGIPHPMDRKTKQPIPLTTDLLLTLPLPIGTKLVARAVKPSSHLRRKGVIKRLELERRSWKVVNVDWGIITELDIDLVLIKNFMFIYKFRDIDSLHPLSSDEVHRASQVLTNLVTTNDRPLCDLALLCDQILGYSRGTSLKIARHLIASRQWIVNMFSPFQATEQVSICRVALRY